MLTPTLSLKLVHPAKLKVFPAGGTRTGATGTVDLLVAVLDAVTPDMVERFLLQTPGQYRQTFAYTTNNIEPGMLLEIDGHSLPIKGVAPYPDENDFIFYHIIVEALNIR